ncbi:MAG: hypothetical protein FWF24_02925 [Alphaproteobacteria bacterium]|nr:hypothetical protein [Alphaproteobacteria bacterium]
MFKGIDRATETLSMFPLALCWTKEMPLKDYKYICSFRAPPGEYSMIENSRRGRVYQVPDGQLYFADAIFIQGDSLKSSRFYIRELGFQKLRALPAKNKWGHPSPNEWEELKANLDGPAPENVKNDLRALLKNPEEWQPSRSLYQTYEELCKVLGIQALSLQLEDYKYICKFRAPPDEYSIMENNHRGVALQTPDGQLYFVDVDELRYDPGPSRYHFRELGIQKLRALPAEGKRNRVNPNEWEELMANLDGPAPENVRSDLSKLFRNPEKVHRLIIEMYYREPPCKPKTLSLQ